jgi:hypothetical protein
MIFEKGEVTYFNAPNLKRRIVKKLNIVIKNK